MSTSNAYDVRTMDEEPFADLRLAAVSLTDVGCKRSSNQDVARAIMSEDGTWGLILVADGMGGHKHGELASGTAADMLRQRFLASSLNSTDDLVDVVLQADSRISAEVGGGTTIVAALVDLHTMQIAHLGDSRAYLWREGELRRLTIDHSWVQSQVDAGRLSPEEATRHPRRNVLLRAVGTGRQEKPDVKILRFLPGDVLLLCSDGLWGVVGETAMAQLLASMSSPLDRPEALVEAALAAGAPDNVSLAMATIVESG